MNQAASQTLTAWIDGIGLIAPGLPDWATASAVLRGEQDPLQLLFPGGSFDEARKLLTDADIESFFRVLAGGPC